MGSLTEVLVVEQVLVEQDHTRTEGNPDTVEGYQPRALSGWKTGDFSHVT